MDIRVGDGRSDKGFQEEVILDLNLKGLLGLNLVKLGRKNILG